MKHKTKLHLPLCGLLAIAGAHAAEPAPETTIVIGAATESYLHLQRAGTAAGQAQPIRGDVASRSYQRYLESFTRPIPDPGEGAGNKPKPADTTKR